MIASPPNSSLASYCPDLADWPGSWEIDDGDAIIGSRIIELLKPFLIDLLAHGRDRKTLVRHRDNIWLLGGEMIRRRYEDPDCAKLALNELLIALIDEDGGPFIGSSISASDQDAFDATCRKLYRFMNRAG